MALGWAGMALIWTATTAQAQLYIDVYPSQDDPTKTIWIFGPSGHTDGSDSYYSNAHYTSTIRSSGNYHDRDSWKIGRGVQGSILYRANKPTNAFFNPTPLFSSTNHPKDIDSITRRLTSSHGFGPRTTNTIFFPDSVTNAPAIRRHIRNEFGTAKTIGSIFMNAGSTDDEIGIRGTSGGGNLAYTNGNRITWFGTGIINKPIDDFLHGSHSLASWPSMQGAPYFAGPGDVSISVRRNVIPEPAEYALVFGLFALAFVIFRKYKVQQDGKRK